MKFCSAKWCGRLGIKCYDWTAIQMLVCVVVLVGILVQMLGAGR